MHLHLTEEAVIDNISFGGQGLTTRMQPST